VLFIQTNAILAHHFAMWLLALSMKMCGFVSLNMHNMVIDSHHLLDIQLVEVSDDNLD
jgi:hypothetical protein